MTNFRVLHSSSKGFWGRLRYSCPLPAPPGNLKAAASSASTQAPPLLPGAGMCFLWEQHTPWDALIPFLCFHTSPDPKSNVSTPRTPSYPPGGCLDTQHTTCALSLQPEKQMLQKLPIADTQNKAIFFPYFTGMFSKIFACLTRLWKMTNQPWSRRSSSFCATWKTQSTIPKKPCSCRFLPFRKKGSFQPQSSGTSTKRHHLIQ